MPPNLVCVFRSLCCKPVNEQNHLPDCLSTCSSPILRVTTAEPDEACIVFINKTSCTVGDFAEQVGLHVPFFQGNLALDCSYIEDSNILVVAYSRMHAGLVITSGYCEPCYVERGFSWDCGTRRVK